MRFLRKAITAACATALALGLLVAPTATAQTDITTGRIVGQVMDSEGQPLPGVSVEAKNTGTSLALVAVTSASGQYRIINVPVGTYTVKAELSGFQAATRGGIVINLGAAVTVDMRMRLAAVTESLTVTAEAPVVETTQTATQNTVTNEAIQSLPISGRNFTDFVLTTPNTQRETQRGNLSLGGQRGINTLVTVDGVDYTNAFFGGTTGAAEGRAPIAISQESVREFQVVQAGASAEYGRSGGGFVNVITKSGTNEWHGSAFGYYRPSDWSAKIAPAYPGGTGAQTEPTDPRESKKNNLGLSLGSAAIKDSLFFFASYERQRQNTTIPIAQGVRDAEAIIVAKFPNFPVSGKDYTVTQDADVWFGRLDYQAGGSHRFTGRVNHNKYDGENGTSTSTNQSLSHNGIEGMKSTSAVVQWNGMFGANLINDFNVQYVKEDTPRGDKGLGLPEIQIFSGGPTLGETAFLPIAATQNRYTFFDSITYLTGNHVAKAGVEYNDTGMDQVFKGNWRGVFIFSATGTGSSAQTAMQNFTNGKWNEYREFLGLGGLTADQAGKYDKRQKEYAFFLQDQWYATPKLTVTLGLRYEYQKNPGDPVLDAAKVVVPANGIVQPDASIPSASNQWSPRLSLAWSPDAKTVVRFSAGRYYSRFPALLTSQLYTSNAVTGTQYNITGAGVNGPSCPPNNPQHPSCKVGWGTAWNPMLTQQIGSVPAGVTLATPGAFVINPDFKNNHTDLLVLGAERDLMGISIGAEGQYSKGYDLQRMGDLNLVASTNPTVDCPQLDPNSGVTCYGKAGKTNRPNSNYARLSYYTSDGRSEFVSATLKLRKNFSSGLRFFGAATWAQDRDSDSNERNYAGLQMEDVGNPEQAFGYSDRDIRWRFVANASYDFKIVSWLDAQLGALFTYQTGRPFSPLAGQDLNLDGNNVDRPTVDGVHLARNSYRYPDFYTVDLRFGVGFGLGPGKLSLLGECYNCTNTANRGISNTTWGTGQTPNATFNITNTATSNPRTLQAAIRYDF